MGQKWLENVCIVSLDSQDPPGGVSVQGAFIQQYTAYHGRNNVDAAGWFQWCNPVCKRSITSGFSWYIISLMGMRIPASQTRIILPASSLLRTSGALEMWSGREITWLQHSSPGRQVINCFQKVAFVVFEIFWVNPRLQFRPVGWNLRLTLKCPDKIRYVEIR